MLNRILAIISIGFVLVPAVHACSICDPNFQQKPTLRQQARLAKFVVLGTLSNARLDGEKGLTDFHIDHVVQTDPSLDKKTLLTIPGYIPFDPKNPPRYLLFGEFLNGKLDVVHARMVSAAGAVDYLKAALKIDDRERSAILQLAFQHLDDVDVDVAADAFHELARASDTEVAAVARKLSPEKFRKFLTDPKTPADRLGIYAYLLGACGDKTDAALLSTLLQRHDERTTAALTGLLGGLIELQPEQGWKIVRETLGDAKEPFSTKLAVIGTIRFQQACKPNLYREAIQEAFAAVVVQGDMADMAIEDLRRWQWWDLTKLVLAQEGKPSHKAPIVRRSIVRYALSCPRPEAVDFVKAKRLQDADLVKQVEESLEFEKPFPPKSNP